MKGFGSCLISGSSLISCSCLISGELSSSRLIRFEPGSSVIAVLHAAQWRFSLPWGQGLYSAQQLFSLPWGQGLHSAQSFFTLL